jgi:hypothetical protein
MAGARYAHNALIVGLVQPAGVVRGILATPGAEQNESLFGDAENVQKPRPEMCKSAKLSRDQGGYRCPFAFAPRRLLA